MDDGSVAPSFLRQVPKSGPLAPVTRAVRRRPITLILGMPSSGTSLCSRFVRALGVDVLDAGTADGLSTPAGRLDGEGAAAQLFDLHERVFELFDRSRASAAHALALPTAWWADPAVVGIRRQIGSLIEDGLSGGDLAVADPHAVRLMPLWLQIVRELKLRPQILFCVRNPRRVADALCEREGLEPAAGEYRWLVYAADFFRYVGALDFCSLEYERWFDEPHANFQKLQQFLGLEWQQSELELDLLIDGLIDSGSAERELHAQEAMLPLVRSAHRLVLRADRDRAARERLGETAAQFAVFQQLQAPLHKALHDAPVVAKSAVESEPAQLDDVQPAQTLAESGALGRCLSLASFWSPEHVVPSAWQEHAPFAFWVTEAASPRTFVELGTHYGFSFLCVCQAVQRLRLATRCYAVDTWKGDDHAGFYGDEVFYGLYELNERHYAGFSRLVRSTFAEAANHFADGTIDLLHIDGRHAYEDVRHDFETWLPKLSERAVVLFHDTNVRERGFGVWQFWLELQSRYPCFEFVHGHGLGVAQIGKTMAPALQPLFEAAPAERAIIAEVYSQLGRRAVLPDALGRARSELAERERLLAEERARAGHSEEQTASLRAALAAAEARAAQDARAFRAELEKLQTAVRRHAERESAVRHGAAEQYQEMQTQMAGLEGQLAAARQVSNALLEALRAVPAPEPHPGRSLRWLLRRFRAEFR